MNELQNVTQQIIKLHTGIESSMRRSVTDAIEIGRLISEEKEKLKHGQFIPWIGTLPFDERTAQRYIKLHHFRCKCDSVSDLQTAYRQIESLEAQEKASEHTKAMRRVAEYRRTGVKPEGWRRGTDDKLVQEEEERDKRIEEQKKRVEAIEREQVEREQARTQARTESKASSDMFTAAIDHLIKGAEKKAEWKEKIRLSSSGDDPFYDVIIEYLDELDDDNRRVEACYNIIKIAKGIAVELQKTMHANG